MLNFYIILRQSVVQVERPWWWGGDGERHTLHTLENTAHFKQGP